MPGTFDLGAAEFPFAQWATRVRTGVIKGVERPLYIEDRDPDAIDVYNASSALGNLLCRRYFDKIVHHPPFSHSGP